MPPVVNVTDSINAPVQFAFLWTITEPPANLPPIVTNPGPQTNNEGDVVSLQIVASDPEGQALSYAATNLPSGLSINPTSGLISGTTNSGGIGVNVTVSVSDNVNPPVNINFTWEVINEVPDLTTPATQTNTEGDVVSLQVVASDPEGQALNYGATNLPPGLSINPTSGLISGTIAANASASSPYNVSLNVSDGLNSAGTNFTWNVNAPVNNPPVVSPIANQTSIVGASVNLQVVATDTDVLSYGASGLPAGLSINPTSGLISGTISAAPGTYPVTVTVSDGVNPGVNVNFSWTVNAAPAGPQVTQLTLVNVDADGEATAFTPLVNGGTYSLSSSAGINVQAETSGTITNIQFFVDGTLERTEGVAPYTIAGDFQGGFGYYHWDIDPGTYVLTATPGNNPGGSLSVTVTFTP